MRISKKLIKKAKIDEDKFQSFQIFTPRKEKIIQSKLNGLLNTVRTLLTLRNPQINQSTVQEFVRIFYSDLIQHLGQPDQDKYLKSEIYKRGKSWLSNHGVMVPEFWGATLTLKPKVFKGVSKKTRIKQTRLKAKEYQSVPVNRGKRKKISKEMDKILKKIEENKSLRGDKPRKKLNERIQIVSGGLPGLGKRR